MEATLDRAFKRFVFQAFIKVHETVYDNFFEPWVIMAKSQDADAFYNSTMNQLKTAKKKFQDCLMNLNLGKCREK